MAKILYGVGGEGRGHATRTRAVVEALRTEHEFVIYAPAHAYDLLAPAYADTAVEVRRIPGLRFHYDQRRRMDYLKTGWYGLRYITKAGHVLRHIRDEVEAEEPDLVITDFEPLLPRAAKQCGIPFVSLDHQHFLLTYDLSSLPRDLRVHAANMATVVRAYYSGQVETLVSSFYFPPLRPRCRNVSQIGVLLRPEILGAAPEDGDHVVAYLRRFAPSSTLETLAGCGREVRLYGLGQHPSRGGLRFLEIDVLRFVEDLSTGCALVCTAGNQLVGEALFLGKPVLAMPEPNNFEQSINAHFLAQSGAGESLEMEDLTPEHLRSFLDRFRDYRRAVDRTRLCGNPAAIAIINRHLPGASYGAPEVLPLAS